MMWFFRHFWIVISYHIFLLNQVEGAIAIPPSNSAPLPLFCPSVCPSVCPSIGLLTTFSGFCTFADKSLGRNGIELEMQMFPDDLPLANIDADGYCCHFMRLSVRPWAWVCVLHTKSLEEMAYNLACWCIQMTYTQHSWMLMDIAVGPSVRLFVYGIFSKVRVGAKEGGSHYWETAVAITCGYGGYLLPLLAVHSSFILDSCALFHFNFNPNLNPTIAWCLWGNPEGYRKVDYINPLKWCHNHSKTKHSKTMWIFILSNGIYWYASHHSALIWHMMPWHMHTFHIPFWWEFISDWWSPLTKGQWYVALISFVN